MRVVLIGDSIRLHYQSQVAQLLGSTVDIWGPTENCETSQVILEHLDAWVIAQQPDVVHLNAGLHDLRRNPGVETPVVEIAEYRRNLKQIVETISQKTTSKIIWATTTPVHDERHQATRHSRRFNTDVLAYNTVAREVFASHPVVINDLYGLVEHHGRDTLLKQDGVHFMDDGYTLLAKHVAASIASLIVP